MRRNWRFVDYNFAVWHTRPAKFSVSNCELDFPGNRANLQPRMIHTHCAFLLCQDFFHGNNPTTRQGLVAQTIFFLPVWPVFPYTMDTFCEHLHDPQIRVPRLIIHHIRHLFQEKQKPRCLGFPAQRV